MYLCSYTYSYSVYLSSHAYATIFFPQQWFHIEFWQAISGFHSITPTPEIAYSCVCVRINRYFQYDFFFGHFLAFHIPIYLYALYSAAVIRFRLPLCVGIFITRLNSISH